MNSNSKSFPGSSAAASGMVMKPLYPSRIFIDRRSVSPVVKNRLVWLLPSTGTAPSVLSSATMWGLSEPARVSMRVSRASASMNPLSAMKVLLASTDAGNIS